MTTGESDPMSVLGRRDEVTCRVRDVLDRVGSKWTVTVIHELGSGSRRFTEIKNAVPGISQRMLTETLRGLERDGLVERTVHPVVPPRVDYELTSLGRTLLESVRTVLDWALEHVDDIDVARKAYDGRT
ncbi:winged helix-turn-helix transcriptional regulator [Streptomyces sp. NPDC003247]|uniref:winged helix-turn-helix transcriptional regulator n=1 Tax=Streptomyces sp. NPDC003247 TaxID=3364677 RepID=UPI00367797DC